MNYRSADVRVRQLEEELSHARRTIVGLAPERFHDILEESRRTNDPGWLRPLINRVVEDALARSEVHPWSHTRQLPCPLCGRGSSFLYAQGFEIPVGLERHLKGSHRMPQCPVVAATLELKLEAERRRATA